MWHGKEYKIFSFLLLKFMSMSGKKKKKKKKNCFLLLEFMSMCH